MWSTSEAMRSSSVRGWLLLRRSKEADIEAVRFVITKRTQTVIT